MSPAVMAEPVETLFGCGLVGPKEPWGLGSPTGRGTFEEAWQSIYLK